MKLTSNTPGAIQAFIEDALSGPVFVPGFPVSKLPDAAKYAKNTTKGGTHLIYVYDETGGAVPAFSDGSVWRRVTDRNQVS